MGDELETREKLLESAMAEFSENGYMKASLRKICADAGVTTGALYFFFKNTTFGQVFVIISKCKEVGHRSSGSRFTDSTKRPLTGLFITTKLTFTTGNEYKHRESFTSMFINNIEIIYIFRSNTKTIGVKMPFGKGVFIILSNRVSYSYFLIRGMICLIGSKKILKIRIPYNYGILAIYLFHKFTEGILRAIRN